jgi:hypothetical protein
MARERAAVVEVDDFPGLFLNADPGDVPTGASLQQTNVQSRVPGELRARSGYREVHFED